MELVSSASAPMLRDDTLPPLDPPPSRKRRLAGSEMTRRQLGRAAAEGRSITFYPVVGEPIQGFLVGMDDYHWFLVDFHERQVMLHKGQVVYLVLHPEATLDVNPVRELVEEIGSGFRRYCADEFAPTRKA